jgi:carbon monoxide dehydrogenase subunit G
VLCVLTVCSAGTATFSGTVALVESGSSTTVTLTVTAVGGDATALGSGALPFVTATAIQDRVANAATGTFTTAGTFKLF